MVRVGASLLLGTVRAVHTPYAGWDHRGVLEIAVTIPNGVATTEEEGIALLRWLRDCTGWRVVDSEYFQALQVPVLSGRLFEPGDADESAEPDGR